MNSGSQVSIVIPAKNEAGSLPDVLQRLKDVVPGAEVIVVDDGSTDETAAVAQSMGARIIRHPYSKGNGAAIKSGARAATGDVLVFMDADGQHDAADVTRLLAKMTEGYDLVIGARGRESQASLGRMIANGIYNRLASWMVGHTIADLTSGFRAVRTKLFREILHLLPNGFSYPTTTTMAFFRAGHAVAFVPIRVARRENKGKSHIRLFRDGGKFVLIIFKIGTLYSPLKIFVPTSLVFFAAGCWYYAYTFITLGRFTNMGLLLFSVSAMIFMIGLVSEQITTLIYRQ